MAKKQDLLRRYDFYSLFILIWFSYAYFHHPSDDNQSARFDQSLALILHHNNMIDDFKQNTFDLAFYEGHYYSDKAPGLVLATLPLAWLLHQLLINKPDNQADLSPLEVDKQHCQQYHRWAYWVIMLGIAPIAALGICCLYLCLQHLTQQRAAALFASICLGLGTPLWFYGGLFWQHGFNAGLLAITLYVMLCWQTQRIFQKQLLSGLALGWLWGLMLIVSYVDAVLLGCLGLLTLYWAFRKYQKQPFWALAFFSCLSLGLSFWLAVFLTYNQLFFHHLWHIGYSHTQGFQGMKQGFFGICLPNPFIIGALLFGKARGLLLISPILALGFWGLLRECRTGQHRALALTGLAAFTLLLCVNSGYVYWHGGGGFGPRHLGDGLPFLGLGIGLYCKHYRTLWHKALFGACALWSVVFCLIGATTGHSHEKVLVRWETFAAGQFAQAPVTLSTNQFYLYPERLNIPYLFCHQRQKNLGYLWNGGRLLGLTGFLSLLPLLLFWLVGGALFYRYQPR